MAYEIIGVAGSVVRVRILGLMQKSDLAALQDVARGLIEKGQKVRVLAIIEDFKGWKNEDDWSDIDFRMAYGSKVVKMAIVGEERWRDDVFAFLGKGLTATEVEFFPVSSLQEAGAWVEA
jgi:hypothetical protein